MRVLARNRTRERPGEVGSLQVPTGDYGGWAKRRWHALGAQRYPRLAGLFEGDIGRLIREYVIPGHAPEQPLLDTDDTVVTLGSCFARELRNYLDRLGFASETFWIPAGLHNSFAMLDFISWAATGDETDRAFRYDRFDDGEIREWKPEGERAAYAERLAEAGAFVFTFGLAEVWQDRETGGVFWRGVPEEIFDVSIRSSTIFVCTRAFRSIASSARSRMAASRFSQRNTRAQVSRAFSSVRSAWESNDRNSSFLRLSSSARARASRS